MNLIEECVRREAERQLPFWGEPDDMQMAQYRTQVAAIVADVLDLLSADGRITTHRNHADHERGAST